MKFAPASQLFPRICGLLGYVTGGFGRSQNRCGKGRVRTLALALLLFAGPYALAQEACLEGGCVFVGPRLASFDSSRGALSNALFTALLGSHVSLDVLDWNALVHGDVNLLGFLNALALELNLSSPDEALGADATLLQLFGAAATVAEADGNTALVSALDALALPVAGLTRTISVADLLSVVFPSGALVDTRLNVLSLVTGFVQLYNYENVLTTPQPVTLSGSALGLGGVLSNVDIYLQVVEPPIYTCGVVGTEFYSAAIRLKLNLDIVDLNPDSSALVSALKSALGLVSRGPM